jgi:hypothetical protein
MLPLALSSETADKEAFSTFFKDFDFSKPNLSKTFSDLKLPLPTTLKDYQFQYVPFDEEHEIMKLLLRITYARSNKLTTILKTVPQTQINLWKVNAKSILSDMPETKTTIQTIAHLFSMHSTNPNFDVGMSLEFLTMLGLTSKTNLTREKLKTRQLQRHFLNLIMRDQTQLTLNARSLVNAFFTKSNIYKGEDMNIALDKATGRSGNSILDGETIYLFKHLFLEKHLQLDDESNFLFKQYMWFLKEHLKISHLSLVTLSLVSRSLLSHDIFVPPGKIIEFYKTFYSKDPNIAKKQPLRIWLDVDIITFLLWSLAVEMPMLNSITADTPPKLNPMSQIWIYSDIVRETIVNNEFKKLLAVGNVSLLKSEKGHEQEIAFREPVFKHLGVTKLDEIDILIATKFGNPCPFADGPSTVQLRFEAETFVS